MPDFRDRLQKILTSAEFNRSAAVTACGGSCLSAAACYYTGTITGTFVVPGTMMPAMATELGFRSAPGNQTIALNKGLSVV